MFEYPELQDLMMTGLKTYFDDCFLSTELMTQAATQTGSTYTDFQQLRIQTGVQQGSTARANYSRAWFNPLYSVMYFKARMYSMDNVRMFAGFKHTTTAPTWGMTESCMGLYMDASNDPGTLYLYAGNGSVDHPNYQAVPVRGIPMENWIIYKLEGNKLEWYSLPYTVPYFDKNVLPALKQGLIRKWSAPYYCGSVLPDDTLHYLVFYIENTAGENKYLELQRINYAEVYPD